MFSDRTLWRIFSLLGLVVFALIGVRLFHLQVINYSFYDDMVDRQSSASVTFVKDRGLILDKTGEVLAENHKTASVYVFASNVKDPDQFVKTLTSHGVAVKKTLVDTLKDKSGFVWIARQIDIERAKELKGLVKELDYEIEDTRFYPEGRMLAGVLGYTGVDNQGLEGIEYYADKHLAGKEIPVTVRKDSTGRLILFDNSTMKLQPDSALYLTVNAQLQGMAERILRTDMESFKAKRAIALAMDVRTGEIILSAVAGGDEESKRKNASTMYLFEPGSIFKAVSFGHLIEAGQYRANEVVNTSRPIRMYGHEINDVHTYPSLKQLEIFTKSSNVGMVTLTSKTDSESVYNFMSRSGFGRKINIDAMSEEAGLLREPKKWSGLSKASISIGQEILVSPMQMVRYYAAIANRGLAVKPTIIYKYEADGKTKVPEHKEERIFSENTAATLMNMVTATVESGTGKRARTKVLNIGGKSGTAQLIDQRTKTYSTTDYIASFAGIFPIEEPRVAMIVIYEAPQSSIYGGETGGTTFRRIAEQVAFFYNFGNGNTKVQYANK
ncbi:MAG: penicillin-binding protein 2 [Deferribacteraceae bacterium]|jgi:cell division protein FtsI (penicillin-binding protein 3)|nr:penicillin-binding protein 2 [Deferribacteraceae bacterium]